MLPVYYTDAYLEHKTGTFHPERPARLTAIVNALQAAAFAAELDWRVPRAAMPEELERVHPPDYLQSVADLAARGGGYLDADTLVSAGSYEAACLAAGGWVQGVETVLKTHRPAFVLCRPPGHHAEPRRGMGFCLFSNAAIAALAALDLPGVQRVAIFDWDVHHGNGTQAVVEDHPQLAYASIHQWPHYPGTGSGTETGVYNNICNVPLPAGSDWSIYAEAMTTRVIPFLQKFQPDLMLVSAGFDCAQGDPLASMNLKPADFGQLAELCLQLTPSTLFGLEGGYDLTNLAQGWISVAQACLAASQKSVTV
jgi:acetoin utilization deacetylase AcuC-like enzyme